MSPPPEIPLSHKPGSVSSWLVCHVAPVSGSNIASCAYIALAMYGAGMYLESCNCNPILYLPSSPSESHSQGQKVGRLSEWERETENQYDIEFYPRLVTLLTDTPCYCYFKTCFTVISLSLSLSSDQSGPQPELSQGVSGPVSCYVTTRYFS